MGVLVDLFLETNDKYQKSLKGRAALLYIAILVISLKLFRENYTGYITLLLFAGTVTGYYITMVRDQTSNINSDTLEKLDTLQEKMYSFVDLEITRNELLLTDSQEIKRKNKTKLNNMHVDSSLILFLEGITELSKYNPDQFYKLVKGTNDILGIKKELDTFYAANKSYPDSTSDMLKAAVRVSRICKNSIHDFIYTIPKHPKMYQYLYDVEGRYTVLIDRVVESIRQHHNKSIEIFGVNYSTVYPEEGLNTPFDPLSRGAVSSVKFPTSQY